MRFLVVSSVFVCTLLSSSCETEGCLAGEAGCEVPSACTQLAFQCSDPSVSIEIASDATDMPEGLDAVGASGDFLLRNSEVEFVIDAIDHPQHLAPTGGNILDIANRDRDDDAINHIFQSVGALPTDQVKYLRSRIIEGDGFAAVQFDGHLVADERMRVYTRYEIRGCEPGIRVRTEIINGSDDIVVWSNADAFWWGGRSMLPFTPAPGHGYFNPKFGLGNLNDVFVDSPFLVGASHSTPASAIAIVPCNVPIVEGFQSDQVGAYGTKRRVVSPRDYEIYERFIGVGEGEGASPGVDVALEVRRQIHQEPVATVGGRVKLAGGRLTSLGQHTRASVVIREGALSDPPETRTPWTEILPQADGSFEAKVPASRKYVVQVLAFGAVQLEVERDVGEGAVDLGDLEIAASGSVEIAVNVDGVPDHALVIVHPADDETLANVAAKFFENGQTCAPLIGFPYGPSPACNRVLVNGTETIDVPPGNYDIFATAGPFASVARETVEVLPNSEQSIALNLERIAKPGGSLSADFHVHGAKSFDSLTPDLDRVRAFLASGIEVIAATDHDAVWDYAAAREALNADERMVVMPGAELSAYALFKFNPSVYFPQVIGHWNFWPLPFDDTEPRNNAPYDEFAEPAALIARAAERGFVVGSGVYQLNHPMSDVKFARDEGWARALGIDLTRDLPRQFDGTGPSLFLRVPEGSSLANSDYDTQEVMNASDNANLLGHRAFWFYLLNQGIVRAGTANSDSHTLTDNIMGVPRNIVFTSQSVANFDADAFNVDVKAGRIVGTNGPVIEATIEDAFSLRAPSVEPFAPPAGGELHIVVHGAAWVPVKEVRVIVDGKIAQLITDLTVPDDPLAAEDVVRLDTRIALADLPLEGTRDAWIVIEAGDPLPVAADLDCDGVPDTTDNNDDGAIDFLDVDRDGDGDADADDAKQVEGPEECRDDYGADSSINRPGTGPLRNPPTPARDDPAYFFAAVNPGEKSPAYPFAFTNPFILDRNNDGVFSGPGL
jgi:hypothetical protein